MYIAAVILAAGEGKRMKSKHPKVLHEICGKSMINYVLESSKEAGAEKQIVVIGHKGQSVIDSIDDKEIEFVNQEKQLGTGHAVMQAKEILQDFNGSVLILCGDVPLITPEIIKTMINTQRKKGFAGAVLTTEVRDPSGYGRIIRDSRGNIEYIVEERDATPDEKKIKEINSGTYIFDCEILLKALEKLNCDNDQGEYYLTDVVKILGDSGHKVGAVKANNSEELMGINNRKELAKANKIMRFKILDKLMFEGVTIIDPSQTYIDADVVIGKDTIIYPGCTIEKGSKIGENCSIGPNSCVSSSEIGNDVIIEYSVVRESKVGDNTTIGPFANIRPGNVLGKNIRIGDFVELKKSEIGDGAKISHLAYVGDAQIGENTNIGAGVIIVNYDGFSKYITRIGDNSFVGCNSNLISPVDIGDDAYIAAGSTITSDVPKKALSIARSRQVNKPEWVLKRLKEKKQSGGGRTGEQ